MTAPVAPGGTIFQESDSRTVKLAGPIGSDRPRLVPPTAVETLQREVGKYVLRLPVEGGIDPNEVRTRQLIVRKLHRIWTLRDGWRGPGSLAPSRSAREFHLRVLQMLSGTYLADAEPTPTADGCIHMEWQRGNKDFSAEITADGRLVLNVFSEDEVNDVEWEVESPSVMQLVEFIQGGTDGLGL